MDDVDETVGVKIGDACGVEESGAGPSVEGCPDANEFEENEEDTDEVPMDVDSDVRREPSIILESRALGDDVAVVSID